jgi:hypothetical protein
LTSPDKSTSTQLLLQPLGAFNAGQLSVWLVDPFFILHSSFFFFQALQAFAEKRIAEARARGEKVGDGEGLGFMKVMPPTCPFTLLGDLLAFAVCRTANQTNEID